MNWLEVLFWFALACVLYPYLVYPAALALLSWGQRRPRVPEGGALPSVSVVLSAYNEGELIARKVDEMAAQVAASGVLGEVIVVSDGSTDRTAQAARECATGPVTVRVIERAENEGKAAALSAGGAAARFEVLAFADVRQSWAPDALRRLLGNFTDPAIGGVGGALLIESAAGVLAGVGLYWRFESWLRRQEGRIHSTVGVSGSICAVRRALFRPIPPGTILDDVYWPLRVVMDGHRVAYDPEARAFDRLPDRTRDEFRRKVRTLSGNFQLLARLPSAWRPSRNPVWLMFLSHKVLRLAVPWALLALLGTSLFLHGPLYRAALWGQAVFYLVGLAGLTKGLSARSRLAAALASFLVLNAAAWVAFWVWASGRTGRSWHKSAYRPLASEGVAP